MKQNESLAETRAVFVLFAQKPNKTEQSPEYGFFCGGFYGRINENSKNAEGGRSMTNAPKTVLAIHDLPGFGRAALSVIVPVLSTLGVQTVALPTAVLSTHTGGLGTPAKLANPGYGPAALEHYHRLGVKFDCIYSGYLADAAQAKLVEQAFELWPRAFKVVDPVLGDGGRLYSGLGADMVPAMYSLCSKADLIVPNVTEAALLLGDPLPGVGSAEQAAAQAARLTRVAPQVVVTGVTGIGGGRYIGCVGAARGCSGCSTARAIFLLPCSSGAFCGATSPRLPYRQLPPS